MAKTGLAQEVKERPILFSGSMVRAILEGRKTQTRRVIKNPDRFDRIRECGFCCPYGQPGERLWVREGWRWYGRIREPGMVEGGLEYRADGTHRKFTDFADPEEAWEQFKAAAVDGAYQWRPSIHMPRWASRITLELTDVRVERLQDINGGDAGAEGARADGARTDGDVGTYYHSGERIEVFRRAWDELNAKRGFGWDANPFCWVLTFKRVED